jgi:hypothetical protein
MIVLSVFVLGMVLGYFIGVSLTLARVTPTIETRATSIVEARTITQTNTHAITYTLTYTYTVQEKEVVTIRETTTPPLPTLKITSSSIIGEVGDNVTFIVTSEGMPVRGAIVKVDKYAGFTDSEGKVSLRFEETGAYKVLASKQGYQEAYTFVQIYPKGNEEIKIRGLRWPNPYSLKTATLHEMRMAGANYVAFKVNYFVEDNGSLTPMLYTWWDSPRCTTDDLKKLAERWIQDAHNYGLNVMIVIWLWWPEKTDFTEWVTPNKSRFLQEYEKIILEWAEFAQQHKVGMFTWEASRVNDILGWRGSSEWHQSILPKIREKFKGEVVLGFQDLKQYFINGQNPPDFNYTGYDYIGIDLWNDANFPTTLEEMSPIIEKALEYCDQVRKSYNVKIIFTWLQIYRIFKGYEDEPERGKLEFFEMAMNKSIGRVDGMFINGWDYRISSQYNLDAEHMLFVWQGRHIYDLIKKYYSRQYIVPEKTRVKATITIDGEDSDWREVSPLCLDPSSKTVLYAINDEKYIYMMIQSLDKISLPKSEYKIWMDVNLDGRPDYVASFTSNGAILERITYTYEKFGPFELSRGMRMEIILNIDPKQDFNWGNVAEIRIPLNVMSQGIKNISILLTEWGKSDAINVCGEGLIETSLY